MKRGPKAATPAAKLLKGTFQACRDADRVEVIAPDTLPIEPDGLTDAGRGVWLDNIGRVAQLKIASELDSDMFANFCNLQGAIREAWKNGHIPPAAYLTEARRLAEQFGLFTAKSRVLKTNAAPKGASPFDGIF